MTTTRRRRHSMKPLPLKRSLAALGVAVVLGGAAIGVASAQQATPTRPAAPTTTPQPGQRQQREDQFLTAVAGKLGITVDKLKQALSDARKDLGLPANGPGFGFGFGGPGGPG